MSIYDKKTLLKIKKKNVCKKVDIAYKNPIALTLKSYSFLVFFMLIEL
jgi:hypothetical protein